LAQLVIVSNRVAIPEKNAKARAGGLEVAVKAALKQKSGIWFGWSGKVATRTKIDTRRVVHDGITYITLDLSKEDHHEYYNGFTNRVLWPILHYRVDLAEFSRRDLSGYLRVNNHFARELHEVLGPDDLVWVHDYHLMPLAKALRERGQTNRIGFFLHIPCPPPEILMCLSSRVSQAQLKNAKRRCWSILTIRAVSRRPSGRRSRCRWLSGVSGTARCSGSRTTTSNTGPTVFSPRWKVSRRL
jgi:trehalose-6-phosphate synthase